MSMLARFNQTIRVTGIVILLFAVGCSNSNQVDGGTQAQSLFDDNNPSTDTLKNKDSNEAGNQPTPSPTPTATPTPSSFSNAHMASSLRTVSLRIRRLQPDTADMNAINAAPNYETAKTAYDAAIDRYVGSTQFAEILREYFKDQFGVGASSVPADDEPRNLAIYLFTNNRSMDELLTANFKIVNGAQVPNTDTGAPTDWLAGILTSKPWLARWAGNNFLFNYMREIARFFECYHYPDNDNFYSWDLETVAAKYRVRDGVNCHGCHRTMNVRRSAFYRFDQNGAWRTNPGNADNIYGHEQNFEGSPVREPLTPNGEFKFLDIIEKPSQYGYQITQTDRYHRCVARRALTIALNHQAGSPGQSGILPYSFDQNEGEIQLLDRWTDKLNAYERKWKPFFVDFFKSLDFLNNVLD